MKLRYIAFGIVAIIVGIIIYIPYRYAVYDYTKHGEGLALIGSISKRLEIYKNVHGHYPTTQEGLKKLSNPQNSQKKFYLKEIPNDPWGNEFIYYSPGTKNKETYDLLSLGADNKVGGTELNRDISN